MAKPNLFYFATSELSQDAFFAWLLSWADESFECEDSSLHETAKRFANLLTNIPINDIHTIEVGRQWENIDIWAEINDDTFLVIEDKTYTSYHGTQLEDYMQVTREYYNGKRNNLIFTYIKTGNEPLNTLKKVEAKGYNTFTRKDLLAVIRTYEGNNAILIDYREALESLEKNTNAFLGTKMSNWMSEAWQGFYMELNTQFPDLDWGWVNNRAGGFWGAWWNFSDNDEIEMYLQFEQDKLCFKICVDDSEMQSELRNKYYERLISVSQESPEISRPSRFAKGTYMTIAIATPDFMSASELDMGSICQTLKKYASYIEAAL